MSFIIFFEGFSLHCDCVRVSNAVFETWRAKVRRENV